MAPSEGGRQARTLRFRAEAGVLLAAWIGYDDLFAGTVTLDGGIVTLDQVTGQSTRARKGRWSDCRANLLPQSRDLLYIEVGNAVGAGLVFNGTVIRGGNGGAGMIGHIRVTDDPNALCRCGKTGCLEAVGSGWQVLAAASARAGESDLLAHAMRESGHLTLFDIGAAATAGDALVLELLEQAADRIGNVVASLVDFGNPATLVLRGGVLRTGPVFLEVVKRIAHQRCSTLARSATSRSSPLPSTCTAKSCRAEQDFDRSHPESRRAQSVTG